MKKRHVIAVAVISLFFVYASSASAAGYGVAGCGLGSLIFGDSPSVSAQSCAASTNPLGQSFGITSGTSNCDASGLVVAEKEQEVFMARNFDTLSREMAAGSGEHLNTLATLMGYGSKDLASYTKANFTTLFSSDTTSPLDVLTAIRNGMATASS